MAEVVQLRVDVEAANARRAFEQAAESVEDLADELDAAEEQAQDLRVAFNVAGHEADRLQRQVEQTDRRLEDLRSTARAMGRLMPPDLRQELRDTERASRDLHRELDRTEAEARRLGQAMNAADDNVARLGDELDDAARQARQLERAMDDLDADAGRGIRRVQRAAGDWRDAGRDAARAFTGGFRAMPVEMQAIVAGAAAGVATMLGGALNAALLAAVGGGVMAAGVAIAAKESDVVQQAFRDSFKPVKDDLSRFALGFEDELVGAAVTFGDAWDSVSDEVGRAFQAMEAHVGPLADGLAAMVAQIAGGDGFTAAVEAAGPVLDAMAEMLPAIGEAVDLMFESFADGGEGAVRGMRLLMMIIAGLIIGVGELVELLSDGFETATDGAERFARVLAGLPLVGDLFDGWAEGWEAFNHGTSSGVKVMGDARVAADATAEGILRTEDAARKAAEGARKLNDELNTFIDNALASSNAAIAYERAIDELSESFGQYGKSIDITTKAGQHNVELVNQAIDLAQRKKQADIEAAGGEKASKEAIEAANAAYRNKIAEIERNLRALGLNKQQVDALLASYRGLAAAPDIHKTVVVERKMLGPALGAAFGFRGLATGGPMAAGQPYIVGEEGPELIVPERNGMVFNAADTARMMSASGGQPRTAAGGGAPVLQLVNNGGHNDWLGQAIGYAIRTGGLRLVVANGEVRVG